MAIDRDTQITQLNSDSSFYDWFQKENTEIIEKLNLINTFTVEGGDGITAPIALSGKATISLSGKVDNGISFNGPVYFNNTVAIPNISVRVPTINSTVGGYTFGTPVRVYRDIATNTNKYEAARGNDPDQAEVFGVVSEITSTYAYVTLLGQITGDFSTVNARGIGLTAGWIYFLDPGTTGSITDVEPIQTGQVSKPVIMGITGNVGMVLQMRGNYLNSEGFSGGTGANDRIIINTGSSDVLTSTTVVDGTMVSLIEVQGQSRTEMQSLGYELYGGIAGSDIPNGYALISSMTERSIAWSSPPFSGTVNIRPENALGVVTDILDIGGLGFLEISLYGFTDIFNSYSAGTYYLNPLYDGANPSANPQYTQTPSEHVAFIKYSTNGAVVVNKAKSGYVANRSLPASSSTYISADGASGGLNQGTNYLVNGNFEVWQRDNTGRENAYTATGSLVFADMWRRHDDISGSDGTKSYSIIRSEFDEYQTEIEGNPRYYVDFKHLGLSAMGASGTSGGYNDYDHLMVGHVIPGAKKFDLNNLNVKFYGKISTDIYPVDVYFTRYSGLSLIDYKKLGTANLTGTWQPFTFNSPIAALENNGIDIDLNDDYCEVGIDFIPLMEQANINGITLGQNITVSVASFVATVGTSVPNAIYQDYNDQLEYCQQFYYTNYTETQTIGSITMFDTTTPTSNSLDTFILPNKTCNMLRWPTRMRVTPTVSIYSPFSGVQNDAYNKTVGLDMRNTSGTIGYGSSVRESRLNAPTISATPSIHGANICALGGYVTYDELYFNIVANSDFSI